MENNKGASSIKSLLGEIFKGFILATIGFIFLIFSIYAISDPWFRFVFGGCGSWFCDARCETITQVLIGSIWALLWAPVVVVKGILSFKVGKYNILKNGTNEEKWLTFYIFKICVGFTYVIVGLICIILDTRYLSLVLSICSLLFGALVVVNGMFFLLINAKEKVVDKLKLLSTYGIIRASLVFIAATPVLIMSIVDFDVLITIWWGSSVGATLGILFTGLFAITYVGFMIFRTSTIQCELRSFEYGNGDLETLNDSLFTTL